MKTKHFYPILFALLFLPLVSMAQSSGIYLYYPGLTVGAGTEGHADEVLILAFSYGFSSNGTAKATFQNYSITKYNDLSTSGFQMDLVSQKATKEVQLRIYKDNQTTPIQVHQLYDARIVSFASGGSSEEVTNGSCPSCTGLTENITISFGHLKIGEFAPKM